MQWFAIRGKTGTGEYLSAVCWAYSLHAHRQADNVKKKVSPLLDYGDTFQSLGKKNGLQFETIKKIAEKESCVIVGRCADYALAENPNCINVFIHADKEFRTKRVAAELQVNESKAKDAIQKKDKQRASYYNYYTSKKWGDSRSYHLTLDSSALGIDKCVEMILQYRALYLMK